MCGAHWVRPMCAQCAPTRPMGRPHPNVRRRIQDKEEEEEDLPPTKARGRDAMTKI